MMSRRDTIIIAVLVNAALLMILFITAVRSDNTEKKNVSVNSVQLAENTKPQKLSEILPQDDLLNQFITEAIPIEQPAVSEALPEISRAPALEKTPAPESTVLVKKPETIEKNYVNVTVKKGDFLEKIAKANGTSVQAIMKANNMTSTQLKIGQVLRVPITSGKHTEHVAERQESKSVSEQEFYTVKEGDSPWLIASRNHLKLDDLLKLNHLDEKTAKKLRPGDKLRIR